MDYTVVGAAVNYAARIEGLNKRLNTDILISEETFGRVRSSIRAERFDSVPIRGLRKPATIYRVIELIRDTV